MKIASVNPSNYEVLGHVEISTKKHVEKAVAKAQKAFPAWLALGLSERCKLLSSFVRVSEKHFEEIAKLISLETGRPIFFARSNVQAGLDYFNAYIKMAPKYLKPTVTYEDKDSKHTVYKEPWGVVACICPWNYPFQNVAWQTGQALLAGNTIVFKNSEENQLFSKLLSDLIKESDLPDGVFNVLYGEGKVGAMMLSENINMVSFTGSTKTGQEIAKIAAEKFIPCALELGGSSPGILFEDVKVDDELINFLYDRRFRNSGQTCESLKRLIVHKSKFDEVILGLCRVIKTKKVGVAIDEDTHMGPLVAKRQLDLLESQLKDAISKGAKVVIGGKRPKHLKGAFFLPTILTNINRNMRVWKEEVFGPVLPIVTFDTEEEAIKLANDTEYGLNAYVLTNDKERYKRVASKLKAGMISQNKVLHPNPNSPFGGYKKSGKGRINGEFGFDEVTQVKLVTEERK